MSTPKIFSVTRRVLMLILAMVLLLGMAIPAFATEEKTPYKEIEVSHRDAEFTYELFLTDKNGMSITNPRKVAAGETINVEIRLTRESYKGPNYDSYGIEFRLMSRGLTYNYDGTTLRGGTDVREMHYSDGNSVGFAWYDMQQVGESINNPVLAASWSYKVDEPKMVNITVPVALIYITGEKEEYIPVGNATLLLDPDGGKIVGKDVSGTYPSGTKVVLPEMEMSEWVFVGWTDGAQVYPGGSEYTVSGFVTLTPVWKELERNRHLLLDPKGGELLGEDITGYYADGQIVSLPDVQREGYKFLGWTDGVETYDANAEYTVYNTVTIAAMWELIPTEPTQSGDGDDVIIEPGERECIICGRDYWLIPGISLCWICLIILLLILLGILLIILLWKRRFIKYSLVNGDIKLNFKNGKHDVQVEVVLFGNGQKYSLNQSGTVKAKERLRYMRNVLNLPVADIKPGKYKGKLIITHGRVAEVRKCRIKVTEKELKEKK